MTRMLVRHSQYSCVHLRMSSTPVVGGCLFGENNHESYDSQTAPVIPFIIMIALLLQMPPKLLLTLLVLRNRLGYNQQQVLFVTVQPLSVSNILNFYMNNGISILSFSSCYERLHAYMYESYVTAFLRLVICALVLQRISLMMMK